MVRGVMEIHNDRETLSLSSPEIVNVSIMNDRLWFHTEAGQIVPHEQYRSDCDCRPSFLGFSLMFILENEDALTELRLTSTRTKHRIAVFRPKNNLDFVLCLLLFSIETLPLSRKTLGNLMSYVSEMRPRSGLAKMIRMSCLRLICVSLYLFFDVNDDRIVCAVPKIYVLYRETQRSRALTIAETYFGVKDLDAMNYVTLSLSVRLTRDGASVGELILEVVNEACNVFYVPLGVSGCSVDRWLSNDPDPSRGAARRGREPPPTATVDGDRERGAKKDDVDNK